MIIPPFVIEELKQSIVNQLKEPYDRYIKEYQGVPFEEYLKRRMDEIIEELENLVEVTNETLYPVQKRRIITKNRWMKKELAMQPDTGFYQEILVVAKGLYRQVKDNQIEKFRLVYDCDTYDQLVEKIQSELKLWVKDDDQPLCHFIYIKYKRHDFIERALINDINYMVIKTVKEVCPLGEPSAVYSRPLSLTNQPIDPFNKAKIEPSSIVKLENGEFFVDTYYIDDETVFQSYLNVEALHEGLMKESIKILNDKDAQILSYIMSLADEEFYKTKEMIIEIGDIVRHVYDADSKKNYNAVKDSLIKMKHIRLTAIDSAKRNITINLLHNADIFVSSDTNKEVVRIVASNELVTQYVKNQTINMYKRIIDDFKLNTSRVLIYPLQRERIACASGTEPGEDLIFKTNIKFFRGVLYFGNKKRGQQIKMIKEALDEIQVSDFTLERYELKGDNFTLYFKPFTERERIDLLKNVNPQAFLQEYNGDMQIQMELNA